MAHALPPQGLRFLPHPQQPRLLLQPRVLLQPRIRQVQARERLRNDTHYRPRHQLLRASRQVETLLFAGASQGTAPQLDARRKIFRPLWRCRVPTSQNLLGRLRHARVGCKHAKDAHRRRLAHDSRPESARNTRPQRCGKYGLVLRTARRNKPFYPRTARGLRQILHAQEQEVYRIKTHGQGIGEVEIPKLHSRLRCRDTFC